MDNELWGLFPELTRSSCGNGMELPKHGDSSAFPQAHSGEGWAFTVLSASPQVWLWIITMNGSTGQMPSSQLSAASDSMARTPLWPLTANEVSIGEQPPPALPLGLLSSPLSPRPHPAPGSSSSFWHPAVRPAGPSSRGPPPAATHLLDSLCTSPAPSSSLAHALILQ